MTLLQGIMFLFAAPALAACVALVWFVIRDFFENPNVHLMRAEWRDPALLSVDDPRKEETV